MLDAENSGTDANASVATKYGITIEIYDRGKVEVDSDNCNNILGFLKYDPDEQKLTLLKPNASAVHYLTIDAPNTDVVLESTEMIVNENLIIENARSVKVSSTGNWAPVYGKVYIYCLCPVTLEHTEAGANSGVAIKGIEFAAPVSANDFVYYTSNAPDATPTDAGTGTIPARTKNYLRIVPKVSYAITADDATITVDGKAVTSAFAGEKVTVTAAGKENAEFTGWTAEGITLTDKQKVNPTVTFTMPGNNVTLTPNYNVVQDYGIAVGSENTTPTRVTSKNCKDILGNGVLSYDPTTQTLKSDGRIKRSSLKINAPGKDINLDGKDQIAVAAKLIVEKARNVKVNSNELAAIMARNDTSTIDCTGEVDISGGFMAVNGSLNIINSSKVNIYTNCAAAVNYDATITSEGDVTIESTDGRAAKNLTIDKADNVTVIIKDTQAISENTKITASGTVILKNTAEGGPVGTVDFTQADGKKYVYYTSEAEDAKLIDPRIHPLPDTVESSYLRIEPRETYYSITVANGTAQVGDDTTGQITTAFEGETVTVKANAPTDEDAAKGVKFHHWKVEEGSTSFDPTEGSLGSATEAGTAEISFDMPKGNVKLTAVYSIPASVLRSTVTVEGGTAKSTLGEGSDIPAEIGTEVKITATPYDAEKYPGMEFVEWEIKYPDSFYEKFPGGIPENLQLKLDNAKSATTTFKMPVYPVKLIAHWSASPVAKPDPDEPIDEDFGVEPAPMDTTGGAIAAVAVGGAAIWGGYEIATRVILNGLLPEGAAIPANRGQLALLVWNTAGRPEPAGAPAFADVTDPDMAKAAQWCTEQGTMDAKGDRFEPEGWTPKFKVIEVWNKAFPKQ
ncbi:InlB B-repeat-containing protein [Faecalibacterium taiwanense]|uniref:InlB B-repeat-containing protein n=1 Tax=Faecalibacterium taiwanense TaxID=3030638 RepID=UPI003219EDB4